MNPSSADVISSTILTAALRLLEKGEDFALCRFPGREPELYHARKSTDNTEKVFVVEPWGNGPELRLYPFTGKTEALDKSRISEKYFQKPLPAQTAYSDYTSGFDIFQKAFSRKVLRKAILSRVKHVAKPKDFHPVDFFRKAEQTHPDALVSLIALREYGIWLGASPEVLLKSEGTNAVTHSLAGTQTAVDGNKYLWNQKERDEQAHVSAHIRTVLRKSGAELHAESGPETAAAGSVVHLRTAFEFSLPSDTKAFLTSLHPTPAVAGMPVGPAVELISNTEKHPRELYTGYLGTEKREGQNETNFDLYVNLRCMRVGTDRVALYLGGGLTEDSELEAEWEETENKALTLEKLLHG
ncbi:MAG: chorismate-binding protein [Cryomorphaceae bacterium]